MKLHHAKQACLRVHLIPAPGSSPEVTGMDWQYMSSQTYHPPTKAFSAGMQWFLVEAENKKVLSISVFGSCTADCQSTQFTWTNCFCEGHRDS